MTPASHSTALDAVQFERWITTFRGPLIGLCASWCGAWEAGEALARRTLAEAWARRLEFDGDAASDAAAGAWLRRIARGALALVDAGPRPQLEASASSAAGVLPTDFDVLSAAFEALEFHEQTLLRTQHLEPASTAAVAALLRLSVERLEALSESARRRLLDLAEHAARKRRQPLQRIAEPWVYSALAAHELNGLFLRVRTDPARFRAELDREIEAREAGQAPPVAPIRSEDDHWSDGSPAAFRRGRRARAAQIAAFSALLLLAFLALWWGSALEGLGLLILGLGVTVSEEHRRLTRQRSLTRGALALVWAPALPPALYFFVLADVGSGVKLLTLIVLPLLLWPLLASRMSRARRERWASGSLALALCLLVGFAALSLPLRSARCATWTLQHIALDPSKSAGWSEAAALQRSLTATGAAAPPERADVRAAVQRALESGSVMSDEVLSAAHDLGAFAAPEALAVLARAQGWTPRRSFNGVQPSQLQFRHGARCSLPLSLRHEPPTEAFRAWATESAVASWPAVLDHGALEQALGVCLQLEALGRGDLILALRERAHTLLSAHWTTPRPLWFGGGEGGFRGRPDAAATYDGVTTLLGLELMERMGVPSGLDLDALARGLRRVTGHGALIGALRPDAEYVNSLAALVRLEGGLAPAADRSRLWSIAALLLRCGIGLALTAMFVAALRQYRQAPTRIAVALP